jgi:hypothetical protein
MDGQHNLGLQVPSGEWSKMMAQHMSLVVIVELGRRARDASCLVALTAATLTIPTCLDDAVA